MDVCLFLFVLTVICDVLQMDGGVSRRGAAPHHRAGGGPEEWRLSGKTGQLLRPENRLPQEDLRPRTDALQGKNTYFVFIYRQKVKITIFLS